MNISNNMRPGSTSLYAVDRHRGHIEMDSKATRRGPGGDSFSDISDVFFGKFNVPVMYPRVIGVSEATLSLAIPAVIEGRSEEEMRWIAARRIVAPVADEQAVRNVAVGPQPCNSMGFHGASIDTDSAVVVSIPSAHPFPARIGALGCIDSSPEAFWCNLRSSHSAPPVQLVRDRREAKSSSGPVYFSMENAA